MREEASNKDTLDWIKFQKFSNFCTRENANGLFCFLIVIPVFGAVVVVVVMVIIIMRWNRWREMGKVRVSKKELN